MLKLTTNASSRCARWLVKRRNAAKFITVKHGICRGSMKRLVITPRSPREMSNGTLAAWVILWWMLLLGSCAAVSPPVEFSTMDPSPDQWRIAGAYSREAMQLRQKARN